MIYKLVRKGYNHHGTLSSDSEARPPDRIESRASDDVRPLTVSGVLVLDSMGEPLGGGPGGASSGGTLNFSKGSTGGTGSKPSI